MAREQTPPGEGLRIQVVLTIKRVKPADFAALVEHLDKMKADWLAEYEINQRPESQFPPGA